MVQTEIDDIFTPATERLIEPAHLQTMILPGSYVRSHVTTAGGPNRLLILPRTGE